MGIYDRDYYGSREPGIHARMPESIVVRLIVLTIAVYLVQLFWAPFTQWFELSNQWYRQPWQAYQLLTYGFLHSPKEIWHILLNMYILWLFGTEIEARYGSREFLIFYLLAIVVAGVAWTVSELPFAEAEPATVLGASGAVAATVVLFALNYPHRQILLFFILPMPMWVAACLFVGLDILGAIDRSGNVAFTAHLGGALFALLYYKQRWRLSDWLPSGFSLPKLRRGPKLRVHRPTNDDDDDDMEARVDAILKKINEQGQSSLTRSERKLLEQASREYQQKRK